MTSADKTNFQNSFTDRFLDSWGNYLWIVTGSSAAP